jgi:hypothetical protein
MIHKILFVFLKQETNSPFELIQKGEKELKTKKMSSSSFDQAEDVETGRRKRSRRRAYASEEDSAEQEEMSSFESTESVLQHSRSPRPTNVRRSASKKGRFEKARTLFNRKSSKTSPTAQEEENVDWKKYVNDESKHLIKKCRKRARRTGCFATFFAFINDITGLYMIFFSLASFITGAIKEEYDITDYVIIGLSGIATLLESIRLLFKYKKRSLYFKQASIQYKRIYRKLNKYLFTSDVEDMAHYLSMAYQDVDNLTLNDHRSNFNKFNSSYKIRLQHHKEASED